jgi:hypothetical protein
MCFMRRINLKHVFKPSGAKSDFRFIRLNKNKSCNTDQTSYNYSMVDFLEIKDGKQYGDVFLFRILCPYCNDFPWQPFPFGLCSCGKDLKNFRAILHDKFMFKTIVGTKRKRNIGKRTIRNLLEMQENSCAYCDKPLQFIEFHIEHIIPLCCGGTNNFSNLCISCPRCNYLAGTRWFFDFYDKKNYILNIIQKKGATDAAV